MKPYYHDETSGITIFHGDAFEVIPSLGRGFCNAVIADPPFAIPTNVAKGRNSTRSVGDLSIVEAAFRPLFSMFVKALDSTGRAFVFGDGASYPCIYRAAYSEWQTACIVWDKGVFGMGREFRKRHELILHCWREGTPIFSDGVGRADVLAERPVHHTEKLHDAQKPVGIITQLLPACGNVILDPFTCTGTVLIAAKETGRKAIGIEIEERYCEIAANRLSQGVLFSAGASA